jgi:hypothetical protein
MTRVCSTVRHTIKSVAVRSAVVFAPSSWKAIEREEAAVSFGDDYLAFLKSCEIIVDLMPVVDEEASSGKLRLEVDPGDLAVDFMTIRDHTTPELQAAP